MNNEVLSRFQSARRDPSQAVITGFHALKHAVRFGADVHTLVATDSAALEALRTRLSPDLALPRCEQIGIDTLAAITARPPATGVMALAARPQADVQALLATPDGPPVVLLEDPRTMGNMGACVRACAGAGAAGVLTTGERDPWHADALRGSAGLHFALPVARIGEGIPADGPRTLIAFDPEGEQLSPGLLGHMAGAILAFGTERDGCSDQLLERADRTLSLPMEPGVSSLNLATTVAAVLYAWRLLAERTG